MERVGRLDSMARQIAGAVALCGLVCAAGGAAAQQSGEQIFRRNCAVCHTVKEGQNRIGPSLFGVVGRKAGTAPNFAYSEANKKSGVVWDAANLDQYLADPRKFMPGTRMVFAGLKNPEDRKALIDWLAQQK
ncbi:MAG TPA: cytochrome c family protein [Stellaceae bacterium]|nr:cytochrome c family protein [Stellaceae bacterium]